MPMDEQKVSGSWRGCLFCKAGQEKRVASIVEMQWPGTRARPVSAFKRRSRQGVKSLSPEVIMPGYVFFEAEEGFRPAPPHPDGVIRILTTVDGTWKLVGSDDAFAKWLLRQDGILNVSQARRVGDRIIIHEGPLKDLEGHILKIDRRNENGLVQLEVDGRQIRAWLPFEIVDTDTNTATEIQIKQIGEEDRNEEG